MFRRTLGSAALASVILAADVVVLILFLNPGISLREEAVALLLSFFLPGILLGTAGFALLALLLAALRSGSLAPRPLLSGLPFFPALAFLALLAAAGLFWLNLLSYRHAIPVEFLRALFTASLVISSTLVVLVGVGADLLLFPRRSHALSAALSVLAPAAAVIVPLALRPVPTPPAHPLPLATETISPTRRIILVGVDGLGPEEVMAGVARGNLPAFARILRRGAAGPLATLRPTEAPPIWTTIFTGRLPRDHGVKSFATYRLLGSATDYELLPKGALVSLWERVGLLSTRPLTSTARKRRALWNALNAFGIPTGLVRIWGTYPPERVQGFMLSPYFHVLRDDPARAPDTLYPRDLLAEVESRSVPAGDVDAALVSEFVDPPLRSSGDTFPWRRDLVERALAPDLTYRRAGSVLRAAYDPPFFATYFYGLDVVGHTFLRFAHPESFGDVRAQETRRFGRVVDRYEALLSQWVGEMEKGLRPDEILVVVSGYGMKPVPLWRRLLDEATGGSGMSGTHAGAPEGFFLAVGDGVRGGTLLRGASVLDVAPTLLYLIGLPVARDMEGRVLTEILDPEFARAHPVTFIPSYESVAITPTAGGSLDDLPPLPEEGP